MSDGVDFRPWLTTDYWDPCTVCQPVTLTLNMPVEGTIVPLGFRDFTLPTTGGLPLLVEVTPLSNIQSLWFYQRQGQTPMLGSYDAMSSQATARGTYVIFVSPTRPDTYYFNLFGHQVTSPQGSFRITARIAERYVADVTPRAASNAGSTTLQVTGLGFVEGIRVELRGASLPTLTAADVTFLSGASLGARFDLSGATQGTYDVWVIWPGGETQTVRGPRCRSRQVWCIIGSHTERARVRTHRANLRPDRAVQEYRQRGHDSAPVHRQGLRIRVFTLPLRCGCPLKSRLKTDRCNCWASIRRGCTAYSPQVPRDHLRNTSWPRLGQYPRPTSTSTWK